MRRTKILATLGPASREPIVLDAMIVAGLDAVRLNFSHGTRAEHAETFARVRAAAERIDRPVAVLQDLQGPKVRIGSVRGEMLLEPGGRLVITTRPGEGEAGVVSTDYTGLLHDVSPGTRILLDEGRIRVLVLEITETDIVCQVEDGGTLSSHKGINVPGAALTVSSMTDKDRADVRFGLDLGVDFVALSMVRRAADVEDLRELMRAHGRVVPIVAKIEKPQALQDLDAIVAAADGVMVARGDLAIEASLEMVPVHQKAIIACANRAGKLVITATQMLESMTHDAVPTRAEVTDVANAVLDGTDAVMLSGETAVGKYPVETVARMSAIAAAAEEHLYPYERSIRAPVPSPAPFERVLARLGAQASRDVGARAVVVLTKDGQSAMTLSDERPRAPILAFTPDESTLRRLALYWGVIPRRWPEDGPDLLAIAERTLLAAGLAAPGEPVVVLLGSHASIAPSSIRLARIRQGL